MLFFFLILFCMFSTQAKQPQWKTTVQDAAIIVADHFKNFLKEEGDELYEQFEEPGCRNSL